MQPVERLCIIGTHIASVTYDEVVAHIMEKAQAAECHGYVCAANVHTVSMARRDPVYRKALNGALLSVPDGMPLVWAHRILRGRRLSDRVYGPTLMLRLCEGAQKNNLPIYLYGGAPGVPEKLKEFLTAKYPGLNVAGAVSPPFAERGPDDPGLLKEIEAINASGARLLFVALGAPKQELFMAANAARINPVQIGVGAAFNFHAGEVAQAPGWMQDAGMEWLFRFCAEPTRLWRRYLLYNPYFVCRLFLQWLGLDGPSREAALRQ